MDILKHMNANEASDTDRKEAFDGMRRLISRAEVEMDAEVMVVFTSPHSPNIDVLAKMSTNTIHEVSHVLHDASINLEERKESDMSSFVLNVGGQS